MNESKELPVTLDIDFTVNLMDCLPLCIISAKDNLKNWINQNFMLPVACMNPDGTLSYIITDGVRYGANYRNPETILRHSFVCGNILHSVEDIVDLLINRIDEDWYSVLFVDQYYIKGTSAYLKEHYSHEMLIYGYNKKERIFRAISYARKMFVLNISFDDLSKGYKRVFGISEFIKEGWHEYTLILYQFVKHTKEYPYDRDTFLKKIEMYVKGELPDIIYYENLLYMQYNEQKCFFGVKTNDILYAQMAADKHLFLKTSGDKKQYDLFNRYVVIYKYTEFHKGLLKRMRACFGFQNENAVIQEVIKEYEKIVKICEETRLLYLKLQVLSEKNNKVRAIMTLDSIMRKIKYVKENEPMILRLMLSLKKF